MDADPVLDALGYLITHKLLLTTAESCRAGAMVTLLADLPGTGEVLESGYGVYSPQAKQRLIGVSPLTIEHYGLTSEAVTWEMALGALKGSDAAVALATTGPAGRIQRSFGERADAMRQGAHYELSRLALYRRRWLRGESA